MWEREKEGFVYREKVTIKRRCEKRVRGEEKRGGGRAAEREEAGTGGERGGENRRKKGRSLVEMRTSQRQQTAVYLERRECGIAPGGIYLSIARADGPRARTSAAAQAWGDATRQGSAVCGTSKTRRRLLVRRAEAIGCAARRLGRLASGALGGRIYRRPTATLA